MKGIGKMAKSVVNVTGFVRATLKNRIARVKASISKKQKTLAALEKALAKYK
jgi:hypothetical protein